MKARKLDLSNSTGDLHAVSQKLQGLGFLLQHFDQGGYTEIAINDHIAGVGLILTDLGAAINILAVELDESLIKRSGGFK